MPDQGPKPETRYAPHLSLSLIGPVGQARIQSSRILLTGLGGLGCPLAQYLAASGVGELTLCDFDRVHESNLARQVLFNPPDVGRYKVDVARERLSAQNPDVRINTYNRRLDQGFLASISGNIDLVVDASDNYGTRLAINKACLESGLPWVMGACIRLEGQVMLFDPGVEESPCYRCAYGDAPETLEDCPGAGIFAPVAGVIGTVMAQLVLTRIAGLEIHPRLHLFDGAQLAWQQVMVKRNIECPACGTG
jgi:molybdopterin/thiamine biosynthesis adenylyltransferase